jgi:cytidylate kinase
LPRPPFTARAARPKPESEVNMNTQVGFDRCQSFIHSQLQPPARPVLMGREHVPKSAITISRQSGCGAHAIAEKLAGLLQARHPQGLPAWTIFDRNLMERVLEDHQLPVRLAQFMPEDRIPEIDDIMDELFGVHPSAWKLVEQTAETILRLAELGNVIILGRGANVIAARLPHVLHVRLVASPERRLENMRRFEGLTEKAAAERIRREDLGRQRYLKKYFGKCVDDPSLYHLVVNTDLVSFDDAARLIGELAMKRAELAAVAVA